MKRFVLHSLYCLVAGAIAFPAHASPAAPGDGLIARIEAKWLGVMTKIRGWDADALSQFREGYRGYPADVLDKALAAPSFEKMMATLDAHAARLSQDAMAKAMPKVHAMGSTAPEDADNPLLVEARQLVGKSLGDDARDLVFIPITPCTVWDSRFAFNPDAVGPIASGQTRRFYSHLDGAGGTYAAFGGNPSCPETAQNAIGLRPFAVMMTVYVNNPTGNGWLTFYRDGDPDPSNATISVYYSPGPTRTQTVISKSSRGYGSGAYDIAATSRFATTHASASITGYFVKVTDAGTVTSIATGLGLTGGPITTSGTISADTAVLQARVSGSCAAGSSIRVVAADGSVTCQADTNSGGTVTAVTAAAPLASSGGTTPQISLTGSIPVTSGGTGASSLANNGVLVGQGTGAITGTVAGATGQVLIGNTGFPPSWSGSPSLSGNLTLAVSSTASTGSVMKGASPFIHNYGAENTFVGLGAGNFTTSGYNNTAIGLWALQSNSNGYHNTAAGTLTLFSNTQGAFNTAVGSAALLQNTIGDQNTATGFNALEGNTIGHSNTATGSGALSQNTDGYENVATGINTLLSNSSGAQNVAVGPRALTNNTIGSANIAVGLVALYSNTVSHYNTALGASALYANTGHSNIAVGASAGANLTTGYKNIAIGNPGVAGESTTIRIGTNEHLKTYIAGIRNATTTIADAVHVMIDSAGQLGTVSSSAAVKKDIADMATASSALMKLRPVTFQYKQHGPESRLQYGLVAEEVEKVYPGLVTKRSDGSAETVMYHFLPPMLLNEVQKQQRTIAKQAEEIAELKQAVARLSGLLERRPQ